MCGTSALALLALLALVCAATPCVRLPIGSAMVRARASLIRGIHVGPPFLVCATHAACIAHTRAAILRCSTMHAAFVHVLLQAALSGFAADPAGLNFTMPCGSTQVDCAGGSVALFATTEC